MDTSFEKKYYAAVRYFFPCSTFTNRRNYNQQNKNNFIKPNKLEGFKKKLVKIGKGLCILGLHGWTRQFAYF